MNANNLRFSNTDTLADFVLVLVAKGVNFTVAQDGDYFDITIHGV